MPGNAVILYDGVCNLCRGSIRFILKRDSAGYFKFAHLKSDAAQRHLAAHGIEAEKIQSFILLDGSRHFIKSSAALRIAAHLSGLWRFLSLLVIIPLPIRDWVYDLVASNRYRWFGKNNVCLFPVDGQASRFLDSNNRGEVI